MTLNHHLDTHDDSQREMTDQVHQIKASALSIYTTSLTLSIGLQQMIKFTSK